MASVIPQQEMTPAQKEVLRQVEELSKKDKVLGIITGVFGDEDADHPGEADGIIKRIYSDDGVKCELFGCSYPSKGFPANEIVESISLAKALISFVPREILLKSWSLKILFGFMAVFGRRHLARYLNAWFYCIYTRTVVKFGRDLSLYNPFAKEVRQALDIAVQQEFATTMTIRELAERPYSADLKSDLLEAVLLARFAEFALFFLENDNAYRFPAQELTEYIDKENARKSVIAEAWRLFDHLISRDNQMKSKWRATRKLAIAILATSPRARRIAKTFLLELDTTRTRLDDADWYFCLKRSAYDYRGKSIAERMAEKARIDKEKGHVFIKVNWKPDDARRAQNPVA